LLITLGVGIASLTIKNKRAPGRKIWRWYGWTLAWLSFWMYVQYLSPWLESSRCLHSGPIIDPGPLFRSPDYERMSEQR
jgi:hypothetical protein